MLNDKDVILLQNSKMLEKEVIRLNQELLELKLKYINVLEFLKKEGIEYEE